MNDKAEDIKKEIITQIDRYFNQELSAYDLYNWALEQPHFVERFNAPTEDDLMIDYVLGIMVTLNEEPPEYHTKDDDLKIGREYLLGKRKFSSATENRDTEPV